MAKTYILLDLMNTAHRCRHIHANKDIDTQIGMTLHSILNSIRYAYKMFQGDHLVVCLEGNSWRKEVCPHYKANRKLKQLKKTQRERDDDEIFMAALNEFTDFLKTKTNVTCAQYEKAEADDMIAIFTQSHQDDNHVILSSDSDYYQLLSNNVSIYNGVTEQTITIDGFFDSNGNPVIDQKTKQPKLIGDPQFILFEKCIRGDTSDNIFSAFPGVRTVGSKNKVGITEAYNDMGAKGFNYNNFMLTTWVDENEKEHRVIDRYNENRQLIDLTMQPDDIKVECYLAIEAVIQKEPVKNVGVHFLRFCNAFQLNRIAERPDEFAKILNSTYN